jgi:hypothetical protein
MLSDTNPIDHVLPYSLRTFIEAINKGKPFMHVKSNNKRTEHRKAFARGLFKLAEKR